MNHSRRRLLSTSLALLASAFTAGALAGPKPPRKKIDLNTAPVAALVRVPGIGPKRAKAIVALRKRRAFRTVDELVRVRGIGRRSVKKMKPWLTVSTRARGVSSSRSAPSGGGPKPSK